MSWNFIEHFNLLGHIVVGIILPFLFVLTIIVFVHELGHFLVARWCGIKVLVFSVGFGPELVGFNDRYGTRWKISAIPLGGYVKFFGDENVASVPDANAVAAMNTDERRVSFFHQPVAARAAVVAAGPIANFLLAIAIFATIFMLYGKQETTARVDSVLPGSAAEAAGFQSGDLVLSIDGKPIDTFKDMQEIVALNPDVPLTIVVERGGQKVTLRATPKLTEDRDNFGNVYRIGRLGLSQTNSPQDVKTRKFGPLGAIEEAAKQTWFVVDQTFAYLGKVVVGRASTDQLGGPLRIAQMSGQAASLGFSTLMNWAGLISVSIGLLNLFPIPLLDGGHLLFYGIEAIRGRPLSERVQEFGFRIGLALIVMLMIFTVWNDLSHFRSS
ncbi:MAG TPA: RIP metalloprotease RseP [Xanthobacteraceae bacterium]|nr:RIP metalloprotease RseP [Xanthobacteraceae bacterium]HZE45312.1 RIP metalloprotease RseP [Xanthobacteraceae bacterium]